MLQWRKEWSTKTTKVSFGRTMMKALELLRLAKGTSQDEMMLINEEIKPVTIDLLFLFFFLGLDECEK